MSFLSVLLDYKFVIIFYSLVILLVYLNKKKLSKEGPFMYLYRTKLGLELMDSIGKKCRGFIKAFGYVSVILAYIGFFFVTYVLIISTRDLIVQKPGALGGSPVIPGLPIAGLGIVFPLIIGWISLFIIMIVHEFSHGVVARAHNLKVKSSGLAIFGPILGAFVEPDEKEIVKKSYWIQNSVYAAGPISNVVLWLVCMILMFGLLPIGATIYYGTLNLAGVNTTIDNSLIEDKGPLSFSLASVIGMNSRESGIKIDTIKNETYPAFKAGIPDGSVVTSIDSQDIANITDFLFVMNMVRPDDTLSIKTKTGNEYELKAVKNPANESMGFIGVTGFEQDRSPKNDSFLNDYFLKFLLWLFELLWWTQFISINIGLINLFPIFITDGARILKTNVDQFIHDKKKAGSVFKAINMMGLFIIAVLIFLPLLRNIFAFIFSFFLTAIR